MDVDVVFVVHHNVNLDVPVESVHQLVDRSYMYMLFDRDMCL